MSDFAFLNKWRVCKGLFASDPSDGFNGLFEFPLPKEAQRIRCIASDGMGWQHVSVSFGSGSTRAPSWAVMCQVKDLFWEPEDYVIQFHPAQSRHISNHAGCLHLWRCTDGRQQPVPPDELVGIKSLGDCRDKRAEAALAFLAANLPPE